MSSFLQNPATGAYNITPDDGADLPRETRGIYCGVSGDLHVIMADGYSDVVFKALGGSAPIGLRVQKVFATGTTAADILGLL